MLARTLQTAVIGTMNTYCGGNNRVLLPQPTSICIPLSLPSFSILALKQTNKLRLKCLFPLIGFSLSCTGGLSHIVALFHSVLRNPISPLPISPPLSCGGFKESNIFSKTSPSTCVTTPLWPDNIIFSDSQMPHVKKNEANSQMVPKSHDIIKQHVCSAWVDPTGVKLE